MLTWSAKLVDAAGGDIPGSDLVASGVALLRNTTADPWRIHHIATQTLPALATSGVDTDQVQITLSMDSGGDTVRIDEGWLANTDNGAVTLVHEPSANDLTAIEIRSAQARRPVPVGVRHLVVRPRAGHHPPGPHRLAPVQERDDLHLHRHRRRPLRRL
ncbi:hypothetical protein G5V59_02455 [Nocardioides sp. W3-2-3]|uniref:hypothetical protein n=1 Tax=Nocardioides convexus TaxID=2712224 RepID=UPI002418650B|nr:hypothetical protein [Nocardioides convexus]NGZ99614.1 hypothetical protein [Nocardioides convexus]